MTFAQGSRTRLALVEEASFGATPSNPSLTEIPFTSHSLQLTKQRVQGNDLLSDRIPRVDRHGNRNVEGDISVDLRDTDFDSLIESAFFSSFPTTGTQSMTIGTSPKFFTIEDGAEDITQFRQFTGCAVSQMSISIAPNQMVQATFSMVGQDLTQAQTSLDSSPTAPSGGEPYDSYSGSINEGGSAIAIITSLDFTLTNSLAPTFVVGSETSPQLEFGRAVVEGTVSAYYEDNTLIDKFLDETETSLDITLDDPASGSTLQFEMNSVKYNGAETPVSDAQSRIITIPFVAIYNSGDASNIKVTKT